MTDKEALSSYRLKQAEETLEDAAEHVKYADAFLNKIKEYMVNQGAL